MKEMNRCEVGDSMASMNNQFLSQSMERRIGEDMILDKINRIFDEVAKDRDDFESSYVDLGQKQSNKLTQHKKPLAFDQSA